jgi:hypothetical protein
MLQIAARSAIRPVLTQLFPELINTIEARSALGVGPSRLPHGEAAMYKVHVLGIDSVRPENHVFASRAAAERCVIGFEGEGIRAKIYRTASRPIEETTKLQEEHYRRHTWEDNVSSC